MNYLIDDSEAVKDFLDYIKSMPTIVPKVNGNVIHFNGDEFKVEQKFQYILRKFKVEDALKRADNNPNVKYGTTEIRRIKSERRQDGKSSNNWSDFDGNVGDNSIIDNTMENSIECLIFGKDSTKFIVAAEVVEDEIWLFKNDGSIEKRSMEYWILSSRQMGTDCEKLDGNLFYKYKKSFLDRENFHKAKGILYSKKTPMYTIYDPIEAYMVMNGFTFFKGLKVQDVSVLSFDIETTGIAHNKDSKVLLISNTFRDSKGKIVRKLFALDDYNDDCEMILEWCIWVKDIDPSIVIGHNIYNFDLPYLSYRFSHHYGGNLPLGKDGSDIKYDAKPKKVRKDGSQSYDVYEARIFGRQIIDTWVLSIKYDVQRKYENYRLKDIVAHEGLEKKDRTKFDFSEIFASEIWGKFQDGDIEMWEAFKKYCIEDSDDSLKLYDLMIPQFFYYTQSLPMPFQTMGMTATGRQINNFLCRSYLQENHGIPKPSEKTPFMGAISFGNPGLYSHVYKVDVASLYPSIMITEEIYDKEKDPKGHFLTMVRHFTKERLENKKKAKDTGDRYFKDIEQAQKIVINSAYGLLGAKGLNFNSIKNADKVTAEGRRILQKGIEWVCGINLERVPVLDAKGNPKLNAEKEIIYEWIYGPKISEGKGFSLVNVDTDSFSYTTGKKLTEITGKQAKNRGCEIRNEFDEHIVDINSLFKDGIKWEDDGYFKKVVVVKAKNYVLFDGKTVKIKGQALKGTGKEKALTDFMSCVIMLLLTGKRDHIYEEYRNLAMSIKGNWDVNEWNMKKTVTKAVLNPGRKQEQKVFDAIRDIHYQEGDKVYLYVKDEDTLQLVQDFDGEYHKDAYFKKLHDTLSIFGTLLDPTLFPNYKTGRNRNLL